MRVLQIIAVVLWGGFMTGCSNSIKQMPQLAGDTIHLEYAKLLQIVKYNDYTEVCVADPWHKGRMLHKYILIARDKKVQKDFNDGTMVRVPLQHTIPFSIVYAGLIMDLECTNAIAGMTDLQYVRDSLLCRLCKEGKVLDVGSSFSPNIEKIIDILPDALFISPYENTVGYGRLEETGVPIIECADYMEESALGRAEWIKFFGLFLGCEKTADSLFAVIDSSYCALKNLASKMKPSPSMLIDKKNGSVWYVPGGCSTIGTMIYDAGAVYPFADNNSAGSLALPFETVLEKAGAADIWAFRYSGKHSATYGDLLSEFHGYGRLKAYQMRNCFGCNVDNTRFYEETPFRPDYLLADFIQMAHPEIECLGGLRYFRPVE